MADVDPLRWRPWTLDPRIKIRTINGGGIAVSIPNGTGLSRRLVTLAWRRGVDDPPPALGKWLAAAVEIALSQSMKALELIHQSSYDAATIRMLGEVFDHVWVEISSMHASDAPASRERLAKLLLEEAKLTTDRKELTARALRAFGR
jgi:hypothetical protein